MTNLTIMIKKNLLLAAVFLTHFSVALASEPTKEENTKTESSAGFFKNRKFNIYPIPVIETRPDKGQSYGVMPVGIFSDENDAIREIIAVRAQYNSVTSATFGAFAYFFPKKDQEISIFAELGLKYSRELSFRFFDPDFYDRFYIDASFSYTKTPFGRFFGLGPKRDQSDQSNYTSRNTRVDLTGGYEIVKNIHLNWTTRFHTTDLLDRAIDDFDDTQRRYGGLPNVVDSTNWINEFSAVYDNRPEREYSKNGVMASGAFFFSNKALGSDKNWQGLKMEGVHLMELIDNRLTQAVHFSFQQIFGDTVPFYELSSLGGEKEMRAYTPNRYIDRGRMLFQIEERIRVANPTILGHSFSIEVAPFVEVGRVFDSINHLGFNHWKPIVGSGFRLFVPPNIIGRLDIAAGFDGVEIYTELGYPF